MLVFSLFYVSMQDATLFRIMEIHFCLWLPLTSSKVNFPLSQSCQLLLGKQSFSLFFFCCFAVAQMFEIDPVCIRVKPYLNFWKSSTISVSGVGAHRSLCGGLPHLGEHKTKVLWAPQRVSFIKSRAAVFPGFWVLLSDFSLSDKNNACLVQFLTFRSWQCLFKLTKEHWPCSIHCARSLWSFSAVPLQPSKRLGESKVHIPAAGGNPPMRCLWLQLLFRWEGPHLFRCSLLNVALLAGEWGPSTSSLYSVECIGKSVFC